MAIFAGDFEKDSGSTTKSAFVRVENCEFINYSVGKQGGAIRCGLEADEEEGRPQYDNDVSVINCKFTECKALEAGALYFQDGDEEGDEKTIIGFCTFDKCEGYAGSAILYRSYKFDFANSTIKGSRQYDKDIEGYGIQSFLFANLNEDGIETLITSCTFIDNEQTIEFYSINASPTQLEEKDNSVTFKQCNFTQNNLQSNTFEYVINLEYMLSESITFDKCTFEENAGPCIKQDSDATVLISKDANSTRTKEAQDAAYMQWLHNFQHIHTSLLKITFSLKTLHLCMAVNAVLFVLIH